MADFALMYANKKMCPSVEGAVNAFEKVGQAYIKMALDEPNLFRFVFLNGSGCYPMGNAEILVGGEDNTELIKMIANEFQISKKNAGQYLQNMLIYIHGLAAFTATGMMDLSEEEILTLINRAGDNFLMQAGVPADKISKHDMEDL